MRQRDNLRVSHSTVAWLEYDPAMAASQLWCLRGDQATRVTDPRFSIRSTVNSYGGGAMCLNGSLAFVVAAVGGQILQIDCDSGDQFPLTEMPDRCFGGLLWDPVAHRLLAVSEQTRKGKVMGQQLVAVAPETGDISVLAEGQDFYGAPALSDDGGHLAWMTWTLPDMPWLSSRLWLAAVHDDGSLGMPRELAAPAPASIQQVRFDGNALHALSDHQGWWQPYRVHVAETGAEWFRLSDAEADHGSAPWQLQEQHAVLLPGQGWARVRYHGGAGQLWWAPDSGREPIRLAEDYADFRSLQQRGGHIFCVAKRYDAMDSLVRIDPVSGEVTVLGGGEQPLAAGACVRPQLVEFQADEGQAVSGFFYPPLETATDGVAPPLIVRVHGGPTSMAYPVFDPQVQFWVQNGLAVVDVNYRGSAGFGRAYRLALAGRWGKLDVDDVCGMVAHLGREGLADAGRAFIQGRSAGGYTALMALIESDVFKAGASLFGVSDPARLRSLTHRFESGYLDWLLGDPDQYQERWHQRTPVLQSHRIQQPVIFYQGGRDEVVVPAQTESMVAALEAAGQSPRYHFFPEEGHGFRRADRQAFLLSSLLEFYQSHS
ncbi:MAG: S9 family peptidase [Oleiphilaceae bacterium]|nr:S9 family peptidase [Oleiphilaceae bacterium]